MNESTGLAEALLGLDGFRVLTVSETPAEVVIDIETTAEFMGCSDCGTRAEANERMAVEIRDLACFGRPARLVWSKRRWRCAEPACEAKTWTETSPHVSSQHGADPASRRGGVPTGHLRALCPPTPRGQGRGQLAERAGTPHPVGPAVEPRERPHRVAQPGLRRRSLLP